MKNRHEDNHECFDKDEYAERHILPDSLIKGFLGVSDGKESAHNAGDLGLIPGSEDPLEMGMATHSSILAWKIPGTGEPGELQSQSFRVGHN